MSLSRCPQLPPHVAGDVIKLRILRGRVHPGLAGGPKCYPMCPIREKQRETDRHREEKGIGSRAERRGPGQGRPECLEAGRGRRAPPLESEGARTS